MSYKLFSYVILLIILVYQSENPVKLSELFSDLKKYENKSIIVKGKCVKVNKNIMGKNWVHIQDGSGEGLDLTVTTQESVKVDSVVTFQGTISLNVDLGSGYFFEVIMENAKTVRTDN